MRRFSANYIFPVSQPPIRNGIVEVDDDGTVLRIIDQGVNTSEMHSTEFHNGAIVPGFVNAHCHLELSHLLNTIPLGQGIARFIRAVTELRAIPQDDIIKAIGKAIDELERTGTVAVGDICNTSDTLFAKSRSRIYFHNFIEVFGINPSAASAMLDRAVQLRDEFMQVFSLSTSISPHSTYSLSTALWADIKRITALDDQPVSLHFAESLAEFKFLSDGTGDLLTRFQQLGYPFEIPFGLSPVQIAMDGIESDKEVLFVHNTFAAIPDLIRLAKHFRQSTFVLCPESNLLIEGKLPDIQAMYQNGLRIAMGTDSLASATSLNMLHHLGIVAARFPAIPFAEVLKWATLNGAEALNISDIYGSLEVGKKPGLNLITNFNFTEMKPQGSSVVKRLI